MQQTQQRQNYWINYAQLKLLTEKKIFPSEKEQYISNSFQKSHTILYKVDATGVSHKHTLSYMQHWTLVYVHKHEEIKTRIKEWKVDMSFNTIPFLVNIFHGVKCPTVGIHSFLSPTFYQRKSDIAFAVKLQYSILLRHSTSLVLIKFSNVKSALSRFT